MPQGHPGGNRRLTRYLIRYKIGEHCSPFLWLHFATTPAGWCYLSATLDGALKLKQKTKRSKQHSTLRRYLKLFLKPKLYITMQRQFIQTTNSAISAYTGNPVLENAVLSFPKEDKLVGDTQQNAQHSSIYIEQILLPNGDTEYKTCNGKTCRFSSDLWQAEIYRQQFIQSSL